MDNNPNHYPVHLKRRMHIPYTQRIKILIEKKKQEERDRKRREYEKTFDYFKERMRNKDELKKFIESDDFDQQEPERQRHARFLIKVQEHQRLKQMADALPTPVYKS